MRVVLIHGRAAAMDIPAMMARDWEAALRFGLRRAGSKVPAGDVDVRFAFYGSVWRPDERQPLPAIDFGPAAPQLGLPGLGDLSLWVDQHLGVGDALLDLLLRDLDEYYAIFDCLIDPESKRYLSEDYAFCRRWQQMGGQIFADVMTVLGHVGNIRFQGSLEERLRTELKA